MTQLTLEKGEPTLSDEFRFVELAREAQEVLSNVIGGYLFYLVYLQPSPDDVLTFGGGKRFGSKFYFEVFTKMGGASPHRLENSGKVSKHGSFGAKK